VNRKSRTVIRLQIENSRSHYQKVTEKNSRTQHGDPAHRNALSLAKGKKITGTVKVTHIRFFERSTVLQREKKTEKGSYNKKKMKGKEKKMGFDALENLPALRDTYNVGVED